MISSKPSSRDWAVKLSRVGEVMVGPWGVEKRKVGE
jgi:hypothetical protein